MMDKNSPILKPPFNGTSCVEMLVGRAITPYAAINRALDVNLRHRRVSNEN